MTQVLATADFDIEWRRYASGVVIDFSDAGVIALLKSRKVIDTRSVAVADAISAGATQSVHVAGKPQVTRQIGFMEDPVSGALVVPKPGMIAVRRAVGQIVPWDTTSSELQRAHDAALAEGKTLSLAGAVYNITDPVRIQASAVSIEATDAVLNCANMNGTHAVRLDSRSVDGYRIKRKYINGLSLVGPGRGNGVGGVLVSGSPGSRGPRPTWTHGTVEGFGEALQFRDYAYLAQINNVDFFGNDVHVRQYAGADAGENISFNGSSFYNGGQPFWLQDDTSEIFVNDASIDYNTNLALIEVGTLNLTNVHTELNGGQMPAADWCRMLGNASSIVWKGGSLILNNDAGSGPWAFDHMFNMVGANTYVHLDRVKQTNLRNVSDKLVIGAGAKNFRNTNSILYADTANMPSRISDVPSACLFVDPTMESTIIRDDWFVLSDTATVTDKYTGTNVRILKSTAVANGGTRSLQILKVGGVGTQAQVAALVNADRHRRFSVQFDYYTDGLSGSASVLYKWVRHRGYTTDGVPQVNHEGNEYASAQLALGGTAWRTQKSRPMEEAPAWATHLMVIFYLPDMAAGSLYLDNFWPSGW